MKKRKIMLILGIVVLIILSGAITFYIGKQIGMNIDTSTTSTTIKEVTVGTQNII